MDQCEWGDIVYFESHELKPGWHRIGKTDPFISSISANQLPDKNSG